MKRVAIISNTAWSIYNFRKDLILDIKIKGFEVFCISPNDEFAEKLTSELNINFIPIQNLKAKGSNIFEDLKLINEFRSIFKAYNFEYILTYTAKPNIYATIGGYYSKSKFINTVNGLGTGLASNTFLSKVMRKLFKFAFKKSTAVFFQNNDDKQYFLDHELVNEKKVFVVNGSGINTKVFTEKIASNKQGDELIFLLSARLVKEKGIYEYFEAAEKIKTKYKNVRFLLSGLVANNPNEITEEELITLNSNGTIKYLGAVHNMQELLEKVDIMVLPSYYREGVPRILLEALSKGLPIITTNSVGCKETIIDQINGYMVSIKDTEALTSALEKMILLSEEERKEMGRKSRELAKNKFEISIVNQAYLNLIH